MALFDDLASRNATIASAAGITVFQPAATSSPAMIAAQYGQTSDYIASQDKQVAAKRSAARAASTAAAATAAAAAQSTALATQAQVHATGRDDQRAKLAQQAQAQGYQAGYQAAKAAKAQAAKQRAAVIAGAAQGAAGGMLQGRRGQATADDSRSAGGAVATTGKRSLALRLARGYLGTRYVLGGTSKSGIDCSGLVMKVYQQLGFRVPTHSAADQGQTGGRRNGNGIPGTKVPWGSSALKPGDLIAWKDGSHIAIYSGNGRIIEAANPWRGTLERPLWANPGAVVGIHLNI